METLHITIATALPQESLVCITLQNNRMGATLRLGLPSRPDHAKICARRVTSHLGSDAGTIASVFAIFAEAP